MNKTKVKEARLNGDKLHYVNEAFTPDEFKLFNLSKQKRAADAGVVNLPNHDEHIVWLAKQHLARK